MGKQPRPYTFQTAAKISYIRQHYDRQALPEIASDLGLPCAQLGSLARRQGIKKNRPE